MQQRVRRNRGTMYDLVKTQKKSGQSKEEFCKLHHVPLYVFNYWLKKQQSEIGVDPPISPHAVGFQEIMMPKSEVSYFRIIAPSGFSLEISREVSSSYLRDLLPW